MKDRAVGCALLLALALPAGCLAPAAGCAFLPPAPMAGSSFVFETDRGFLWSPGTGPVVHSGFGPPGPEGGPVLFQPGSRLEVAIGAEPAQRMGHDGNLHEAWGVAYAVEVPGHGRMPVATEWVDAGSGRLVASFQPSLLEQEGKPMHQTRYLRDDLPPVFLASMWWNQTWRAGDTARHTLRAEQTTPPAEQGRRATVEARVVRAGDGGGGCAADIEGTYHNPADGYRALFFLHWLSGSPLPSLLRFHYEPTAEGAPAVDALELRLAAGPQDGPPDHGRTLAAWTQRPLGPGGIARAPLVDGFLSGSLPFPHSFSEARQAALADAVAGPWLREHPDAIAAEVTHVLGSDSLRDTWRILWVTGSSSLRATIDFAKPLLASLPDQATVRAAPEGGRPPPSYQPVSLAAVVELHRTLYGRDPEVLVCDWFRQVCTMGTHDATARPRSGGVGGGLFIHIGIGIDIQEGRLLQEDALGEPPKA
jgi:hypothetical protein